MHFLGILDRVTSTVHPDETTLGRLYRESVALLYPSRHEGFGIPPLEAMACGTVAVTSNTTSLPEVLGDGGIMLDPSDESAWTECILEVAENTIDRPAILANARKRAELLTWSNSARDHVALYSRVAN
jgi:glycosyltransferase involved in cell wall biosynthesis